MDAKQVVAERFEAVEAELQELSRYMYEHPELAYKEYEASSRLVEFLRGHGYTVEYPAWGLDTAFDAVIGEGPEVVICAEYDALPEVGHACGHNVIAAAAAGAGAGLAAVAQELGVRVRVLGTPAEEAYGGKVDLINAGAFETATAAMMVHPSPEDMLDPGALAVAHIDVEFTGKESHAAFAPELGINALDAAVQAYVNVSTLRQHILPTDRLHGVITYGGGAPNVTPAFTSMAWYVRSATMGRMHELYERVVACFAAAAQATGCTYEVKERGHTYEILHPNSVMVDLFGVNSEALGRPMPRSDGDMAGSTDMGNVSNLVPSIHPMLGINSRPAVNHQKEFAAHTITPDGEKAIRDGALAMAWTVVDLAVGDLWGELAV
ncbi:MAG TPA: M20 family metallopeptidase [Acidimicrobiia bacterium]|nr:M20 family metallopeptidase [Acidimicrobiia bacterium]